jgi:hypothetical protein
MCDGAQHNNRLGRLFTPVTALWVALVVALAISLGCNSGNNVENYVGAPGIPTTRTGILIASDASYNWALVSGAEFYPLRGDRSELTKYERQRVTISGAIDGAKRFTVLSIETNKLDDREVRAAIEQLKSHPWSGPENHTSPTLWMFNFTSPILQILQAGPAAQDLLLQSLRDPESLDSKNLEFKNQIIILLGGVGDERAVEPIIQAMSAENRSSTDARRTNLMANLALTNITQSEVIWGHGGGISLDSCPDDPKGCWLTWWTQNRAKFKVSTELLSRRYSNYPNYGIYQQP